MLLWYRHLWLYLLIDFGDAPATIAREDVARFYNQPGYNGFGNHSYHAALRVTLTTPWGPVVGQSRQHRGVGEYRPQLDWQPAREPGVTGEHGAIAAQRQRRLVIKP